MGFPRVAVSDLGTFHGISPSLWITENRAVALIKKYIKPTQKILDLGAGGGELLQALSEEGYTTLEGLDKNKFE